VAEQAQQPEQPTTAGAPGQTAAQSQPAATGRESKLFIWNTKMKIAFAIAAVEALIVWIKSDFTTWTIVIISIPIILFYVLAGRTLESRLGRDISWVAATAQALAVVAAILVQIISALAVVLAAVFAAVVLFLLLTDRPQQGSK
jgi:hypothetical protein